MFLTHDKYGYSLWNIEPIYDNEEQLFSSEEQEVLFIALTDDIETLVGFGLRYGEVVRVTMEIVL